MRHLFLLNPRAGKYDRTQEVREKIRLPWRGREGALGGGGDAVPRPCRGAGPGRGGDGEAVRIYACGGDGTLNECAVGAAGFANAAVTHYPMGSGNDFLRMFGPDAPGSTT